HGELGPQSAPTSVHPRGTRVSLRAVAAKGAAAAEGKRHAVFARLHRAMHQSAMRSTRPLAARRRYPGIQRRRPLPVLRRFPAQRPAATGPALPHAPASADRAPVAAPSPALTASTLCKIKAPKENLRRWHFSLIWPLAFDKPLLDHLVVAEPQVGDVRGAE